MTDKVAQKADDLKAKLPEPQKAAKSAWAQAKPFVNGGTSGMLATCFIQPVDMVKVRLQLGAQGSPVSCILHHSISTILSTAALRLSFHGTLETRMFRSPWNKLTLKHILLTL